jgi:DNA-binding transcriptional regulator PaaX
MFKTGVGEDAEKVLRVIRSAGGWISHSSLVRKMQYTMNAQQLKGVVGTLKESGQLEEQHNKVAHTYRLKEEEDK